VKSVSLGISLEQPTNIYFHWYHILSQRSQSVLKATVPVFIVRENGTAPTQPGHSWRPIGFGEAQGPRKASQALLAFAPRFIEHASPRTVFPLPTEGQTRFYFLCFDGARTAEAQEEELGNNRLPLSPLFHKAHEVITAARFAAESQQAN
jgi:hypothetical protein